MSDVDTTEIDFNRVMLLLSVIEKQSTVSPRATHIGNAAHTELLKMNDAIKEAAQKRPAPAGGDPAQPDPDPALEQKLEPTDPTIERRV